MTLHVRICLLLAVALGVVALGVGCAAPLQRHLEGPEKPRTGFTRQPLSLRVAPTVIAVPNNEVQDQTTRTRLALFTGLFFYIDGRGTFGTELRNVSADPAAQVQAALQQTLQRSGLFTSVNEGQAQLELRSKLLHLNGASYASYWAIAVYGGASSVRHTYLPYGSTVLQLELWDQRGPRPELRWAATLNGSYLPDAEDAEAARKELVDSLSLVAVRSFQNLLEQLPDRLAPMLAELGGVPTGREPADGTFYVARLLPDPRYVERAAVSQTTGVVSQSTIQVRSQPVFGPADQWVLDPYQGGAEALDPGAYQRLGQRLTRRFRFHQRGQARLFLLEQPVSAR